MSTMDNDWQEEQNYLSSTLALISDKLNSLENSSKKLDDIFDESNAEYYDYLKHNANKLNEEDVVELVGLQGRLDDLQTDSAELFRQKATLEKMQDSPYFARIIIKENNSKDTEKYYIGIQSLMDNDKSFKVIDWRSPIASIFYDYESGSCRLSIGENTFLCDLLGKRQYTISGGKLEFFFDTTINIEDELLKQALAKNTSNKLKTIVQTIQKEQNEIIRGDENKNLIVQGVAGSGKTAIALHRIAYLLYKMKGKILSKNIIFISPNNAFSSYISSILPDLAEDDVKKMQLDLIARQYLKKHLILERKYEQIERLISSKDVKDYNYKTSYQFLIDLLDYAKANYIDNFHIDELVINNTPIDVLQINKLFFEKYADKDLFTRLKWIADNIFDIYFYQITSADMAIRIKQNIFERLYAIIKDKNCVKAYMNFLNSKGLKLELVGDKVKNEDAYGILFFKIFIYGVEKFSTIKHLVIDEMQDYSPLQMYILNYLFECPKTILGDYNQSINLNSAKESLEVLSDILSGESQVVSINKSYRSTMQIADFYNSIEGVEKSLVVARAGEQVDFINTASFDKNAIVKIVKDYRKKGYLSIAIILKSNTLAKECYSKISKDLDDVSLIDDNIDLYDNKTCVISAYSSKGLEFDGVIIVDSDKYFSTEQDKNLLYISATRALHKLTVLSIGKPSKFILDIKEKL